MCAPNGFRSATSAAGAIGPQRRPFPFLNSFSGNGYARSWTSDLHGESSRRAEAGFLDLDGPARRLRAHAMHAHEDRHRQAHLAGLSGVLRRTERPLVGPVQRLLDRVPMTFPPPAPCWTKPVLMLLIEAFALLTVHLDGEFELVIEGQFASK